MKDSLGDRMKSYEAVYNHTLTPNSCVFIRVDGRAFHTFTKNLNKPFDMTFIQCMEKAAIKVSKEMQGFKLGYVQSDEATFMLTDFDTPQTQPWFNNELNKIVSLTASLMSVHFNAYYFPYGPSKASNIPVFDARAFVVPKDDAANVFIWRQKDWLRNSLNMYAQAFFSHKEMQGKKASDLHEMLHNKGLNWADLNPQVKNGSYITPYGRLYDTFNYQDITDYINWVTNAQR
jgi:tRNA(His) guanylyltransferase